MAAPVAVTTTIRLNPSKVNPKERSSAVAMRVYEAPKNGVAFETKETRNKPARLKRNGLNGWNCREDAVARVARAHTGQTAVAVELNLDDPLGEFIESY
jgi:hypothetical protein